MLTGPTKRLTEFKNEMTSVYPIKAKIISLGSPKSMKNVEQEVALGKGRIVYQHDPRHIDVLVKDLGLENGNSVQTPATPEVTEEEKARAVESSSTPQVQITGCQMFVPQPRPSRHNIHRERVVPEDVKSHSAESLSS